ncbi:hypothetical protein [Spiroplasma alleghenense]|uniref:Lipoprotein n=1 Tax=Spiroplasma alleghenense TaxID=216931 RepID=A0A345Z2G8_9MOLU|nr:hypothetical protein [Spiroplasma alleghenense]AXK50797.1 hypothetical protein SALLE_v1c01210 [Spiroplasma alleghenense]
MRKLLSVFASATIAVSAPLSVVACKQTNREDSEYDFQVRRNSFIALITQIFQSKMQSFFDPLRFVAQENSPFTDELTINYLRDKAEEINQGNGFAFDFIKSELIKFVNWNSVLSETSEKVSENVNFRSFLVDGKNPLSEGVDITSIKVESGGKEIATMKINFRTQILLLDHNKEREYLPINYNTQVNIINETGSADELNRINNEYLNLFNSNNLANYFKIESNKGNFETVGKLINAEDGAIKKTIRSLINTIKVENGSFVINTDKISITIDEDYLSTGSTTLTSPTFEWSRNGGSSAETIKFNDDMRNSYFGDEKAKDAVVEALSSNEQNLVHSWPHSEFTQSKVKSYEDMSIAINLFNIQENLWNKRAFENKIKTSQPLFAIDELNDQKLISLFGTEIKNTVVEFREQSFELSTPFIIVRQNTEETGTLTLYKKFLKDALNYQILFNGLGEEYMRITNPEQIFYSNKPESWNNQEIYNQPLDYLEYKNEFFSAASEEAKEFQKTFDFTVDLISMKTSLKFNVGYEMARYFWIKEDNSIYIWVDWDNNPPVARNYPWDSQLATFFFSSGVEGKTLMTTGLATGTRGDVLLDLNYGSTNWKFKS